MSCCARQCDFGYTFLFSDDCPYGNFKDLKNKKKQTEAEKEAEAEGVGRVRGRDECSEYILVHFYIHLCLQVLNRISFIF